jgi:hypothetical protein
LLAACAAETESPEVQIRQLIEMAVEAAESRSASRLEELMHPNYLDQRGNRRDQTVLMMRGLFFRHKNVYLFTKIGHIDIQSETQASLHMHVAMAGNSISDVSALAGLRARLYRFELHLIRDESWRVLQASWRPAELSEVE